MPHIDSTKDFTDITHPEERDTPSDRSVNNTPRQVQRARWWEKKKRHHPL